MLTHSNPYLHGTTSEALNILPYTSFKMPTVMEMIKTYGVSPLTGELTRGGYTHIRDKGEIRFGRLNVISTKFNEYHLDKVISEYATQKRYNQENVISSLSNQVNIGTRCFFSNANIIHILAIRAQELGYDISKVITEKMFNEMMAVKTLLTFFVYLDKYIAPKSMIMNKDNSDILTSEERDDIIDAMYTHYNSDKLLEKIISNYRDLPIQPQAEDLQYVLDILKLPETSIILSGISCIEKVKTLRITEPYELIDKNFTHHEICHCDIDYFAFHCVKNSHGYNIHHLLYSWPEGLYNEMFFIRLYNKIVNYIQEFDIKMKELKSLLTRNIIYINPDIPSFPLILICEDDDIMHIVSKISEEYCASRTLELGVDIRFVATDTEENKKYLEEYFKRYNIGISVLLFDDLRKYSNK